MAEEAALVTFSIGPVHGFIAQARRLSDFWAGSALLSELVGESVRVVLGGGGEMLFPHVADASSIPKGLPNRFVCRVPRAQVESIVKKMEDAVRSTWSEKVKAAVGVLGKYGLANDGDFADPIDIAWSWVPENGDYAQASIAGARQFAAARVFRAFAQGDQAGEKCRVCGVRTALPNGRRDLVRKKWMEAEAQASAGERPYFRFRQGCLCLVCATKRLSGAEQTFSALDRFQPLDGKGNETGRPYYALVCMDGDRMGRALGADPSELQSGDLEEFHKEVSRTLVDFADALRVRNSADMNLQGLSVAPKGERPQLIYAGGEDVVFVCDPRDALPLAKAIRQHYVESFGPITQKLLKPGSRIKFTISAAVLYVHVKHPAVLAFREAEELLKRKAKGEEGRDAVAVRLAKRGGAPVEVAFRWDEVPGNGGGAWVDRLDLIVEHLAAKSVSSSQTYDLSLEETTLAPVLTGDLAEWEQWLSFRLGHGRGGKSQADEAARLMAPFFAGAKTEALRIARFLGTELNV